MGADPRNEQLEKFCSVSCSTVPACGCRSSGWALALLAVVFLALVCVFRFLWEHRPEDRHFSRYPFLCSGSSVPCIRSHASAGHLVVYFVTAQMVGNRRSPGATILGVESEYTLPPTIALRSRRQVAYILMPCGQCTRWLVLYLQKLMAVVLAHLRCLSFPYRSPSLFSFLHRITPGLSARHGFPRWLCRASRWYCSAAP